LFAAEGKCAVVTSGRMRLALDNAESISLALFPKCLPR
jgi:hypothetical protein